MDHEVLGEFSPDQVLPLITKHDDRREFIVDGKSYFVRMNAARYFVFKSSLACVACGLVGTKFLLEMRLNDKSPYLNLYGEEGEKLVLFTKDHIQARSMGGQDQHSNFQTMCSVCNNLKGSANLTLDGIRELREIHRNKQKLSKKKLNQLLRYTRDKLRAARPDDWNRISKKKYHEVMRIQRVLNI